MTKTEWFPGNVRPVHVGVYETEPTDGYEWFQFWNGRFWGWSGRRPEEAVERKEIYSTYQYEAWRGLTEPAA